MSGESVAVHEIIELAGGLQIDADEAWRKLIRSQFPGTPARGFCELIQNSVDAYASGTAWADRWLKIETGRDSIVITDFGEGMSVDRLRLLATLGGTDKTGDAGKIGKFGIGFVAIFNPTLGTRKVTVTTKSDGQYVELVFDVLNPDRRPEIAARVIEGASWGFSTRVAVTFEDADSARACAEYARRYLRHFPCPATIDGRECESVWDHARASENVHFFHDGPCEGFIQESGFSEVVVLCKFEYVGTWSLASLLAGSGTYTGNLQAFYSRDVPYVSGVRITVNSNKLTVTISRDGFTLDSAYSEMVKVMADALVDYLYQRLLADPVADTIRANQYTLRDALARQMGGDSEPAGKGRQAMNQLVRLLADAKVYRLSGRREHVSLRDIQGMRSAGLPLFFSPRQTNLRWLGGAYKCDFVVLPTPCRIGNLRDFYDTLFGKLFDDVVNLDEVENDATKIANLAARGIISKDALRPKCSFRGWRGLTPEERAFLKEIDDILAHRGVREAITRNLHLPVSAITTGFIDVEEKEVTIATGLFDRHGNALTDDEEVALDSTRFSNLPADANDAALPEPDAPIRLGLRRDHPFIENLIGSSDPHRAYYALTFLAHELALCQKRLVPYSRFYHWVKEKITAEMRQALLLQLTAEEMESVPT